MADEPVQETTDEAATAPEVKKDTPAGDLPEGAQKALSAERRDRKAAEKRAQEAVARLKELEDQNKSEAERVAGERDELASKVGPLEAEVMRLRVALEKKVPADLIDRLKGDTPEAIAEDADQLLALLQPSAPGRGAFDEGAREPVDEDALLSPEQAHQKFLNQLLNS